MPPREGMSAHKITAIPPKAIAADTTCKNLATTKSTSFFLQTVYGNPMLSPQFTGKRTKL
jgi:hypothetical protein